MSLPMDFIGSLEAYRSWSSDTFKIIDGVLEIKMHDDGSIATYDILLDDIKTEGDLMRWALHISRKTWATRNILSRFMEIVAEIKGFQTHM
jgi:hypothetical protein